MQKINCKYAEYLIAPANAVDSKDDFAETVDGVKCHLVYISTMDNSSGWADEILEDWSQRLYGCPFSTIRSLWIGRLNGLSNYWHVIRLDKV